jgi:hypothetical protein
VWRPASEAQDVPASQETGPLAEANCIADLTEVVVWLGCGPVAHGVDEVEGRMPSDKLELMLRDRSHPKSLSPSNAI